MRPAWFPYLSAILELPVRFELTICYLQGSCRTVGPEKREWHSHEDSNSDPRFRRPLHCPVVLCEYFGISGEIRTRNFTVLSRLRLPFRHEDIFGDASGDRTLISRLRVWFPCRLEESAIWSLLGELNPAPPG